MSVGSPKSLSFQDHFHHVGFSHFWTMNWGWHRMKEKYFWIIKENCFLSLATWKKLKKTKIYLIFEKEDFFLYYTNSYCRNVWNLHVKKIFRCSRLSHYPKSFLQKYWNQWQCGENGQIAGYICGDHSWHARYRHMC